MFAAIPLWAQLGGLAAVAVGAARNMIDRFVELAAAKVPTGGMTRLAEKPAAQIAVGEAEGLYLAAARGAARRRRSHMGARSRGRAVRQHDAGGANGWAP